jgi:hypothetical protein
MYGQFDVNIDKSAGEPICTAIGCPIGVRVQGRTAWKLASIGCAQIIDAAFGGWGFWRPIRRFDLFALALLCGCHLHTRRAVRCKHMVKAGEVIISNLSRYYNIIIITLRKFLSDYEDLT